MGQQSYSIPQGPTAFFHFQQNSIELCTVNAAAWNIPTDTLTSLATLQSTYIAAYNVVSNKATRSVSTTAARDAAQEALSSGLFDLYNKNLINNDALSIADQSALHIHTTGGGHAAPAPAPETTPVIDLVVEQISTLYVVYADSSTPNKHHKPNNVAFAELWYKVGDPAPVSLADCPERFNATRSHEPIVFDPVERGLKCYVFARWVNKNGKTGTWSSMFSAMIP